MVGDIMILRAHRYYTLILSKIVVPTNSCHTWIKLYLLYSIMLISFLSFFFYLFVFNFLNYSSSLINFSPNYSFDIRRTNSNSRFIFSLILIMIISKRRSLFFLLFFFCKLYFVLLFRAVYYRLGRCCRRCCSQFWKWAKNILRWLKLKVIFILSFDGRESIFI